MRLFIGTNFTKRKGVGMYGLKYRRWGTQIEAAIENGLTWLC